MKHGFVDLAAGSVCDWGRCEFSIDPSIDSYRKPVSDQPSIEFQHGLRCSSSYRPNLFSWSNPLLHAYDETSAFRGRHERNDLRSLATHLESRHIWKFQLGRKFRSSYFRGLPYRAKCSSHSRRRRDLLLAPAHKRIGFCYCSPANNLATSASLSEAIS